MSSADGLLNACRVVAMQAAISEDLSRGRLQSFTQYSHTTSWLRVVIVSVLSFVPSFACTVLIELLPLRSPSEGWRANWMYWIRLYLSTTTFSFGIAIQMTVLIPAAGLKAKHLVLIAIGASAGATLEIMVMARYWRFPVPFTSILATPGFQISRYVCLRLSIGAREWQENPEIKKQVSDASKIALIQSTLVLVYPVYNAIFLRLDGLAQVAFVLVLPTLRFAFKRLYARVANRLPAASTFGPASIELFDALYLFKCMQSASSILSGAVLIIVDLIQNIYHFHHLHKLVQDVEQKLALVEFKRNGRENARKPLILSPTRTQSPLMSFASSIAVAPAPSSTMILSPESSTEKVRLDKSVRDLVLECEHIVIAEFIECAVPMFYALYMFILFHLPNAEYYPEMRHVDASKLSKTVRNIATYATLEFISLLYMHALLQRKFNISALHLLANVLERDKAILQSIFMNWVIIVLEFTIEHAGA